LVLAAELEKLGPVYDEKATTTAYFRSEAMPIINQRQVKQNLSKATAKITKRLEEFTNEGSGWRLKRCARVDLGIVQYRPFRGRSYIKTPAYISPRTVINVREPGQPLFRVGFRVYPVTQNPHRPAKYPDHLGELNFTGISFPVRVTDVTKFERQNPGLSVNVFGWKVGLYPLHLSKQEGHADS